MPMTELATLFNGIQQQTGEQAEAGSYAGIAIPDSSHHIAKDKRGRPVILLSAQVTEVRPASIVLENLRIEHGIRCNINQRGMGVVDDRFTVVQCQSEDPILQRCFLDLCETILGGLTESPTQRAIADQIDRLVVLFRVMERPSRRSIQGLWGELALIVHSRDPIAMARAWHNDTCERYDFAAGEQRLEVKTSADRSRIHFLSHEQANPPDGVQCVIASLFVEPSTGGRTLGSVWDEARRLLNTIPELRLRIDEVSFAALGGGWREARNYGFDAYLAMSSLEFYDVRDIPRIDGDIPNGISDIRFRSDLAVGTRIAVSRRPTQPLVALLTSKP